MRGGRQEGWWGQLRENALLGEKAIGTRFFIHNSCWGTQKALGGLAALELLINNENKTSRDIKPTPDLHRWSRNLLPA